MSLRDKFIAELRLADLKDIPDYDIINATRTENGQVSLTLYPYTLDVLFHLDEFSTINKENIEKLELIVVTPQRNHLQVVAELPRLNYLIIRFRMYIRSFIPNLQYRPPVPDIIFPSHTGITNLHLYDLYPEELDINFDQFPQLKKLVLGIEQSRQSPDLPAILPIITSFTLISLSVSYNGELELDNSILQLPLQHLQLTIKNLSATSKVLVQQLQQQGVNVDIVMSIP